MGIIAIMGSESKYYTELLKKLEGFIRKNYLQLLLFGTQVFVAAVLINFTFYAFIELAANFSSAARTVLIVLFILAALGLLYVLLIKPLIRYIGKIRKETYFDAAVKVGTSFPEVKDELLNSMQLVSGNEKVNLYSTELIDASFRNVYERVKNLNFKSIINFERARKILPYFAATTIACLMLLLFVPGLNAASFRLINFDKEFIPPPEFIFEISPGNKEITKGDGIEISVKVKGSKPKLVYLGLRKEEEADFRKQELSADSSGKYIHAISSVKSSFKYFAEADGFKSDFFEIIVIDRPIVKTLELEINSPSYSKIPKVIQKDNGNVQALVGSKVSFSISSTKKLKEAVLEFGDTSTTKLNVDGEKASGNFTVRKDNSYQIKLIDENGNNNLAPITYRVKALYDAFPVIELISPNQNTVLANDNRVPLFAKASDDYGFSKLLLNYRLSASRYEPPHADFSSVEIPVDKSQLELSINYIWNLTQMYLAVDDVVTYYLEIFDNDYVSGPKSAKTQTLTVRVPSLDEILNNADQMHAQSETELEQVLKEAEELKKTLEEIDKELKRDDQKLTWEEKQKIENALQKFSELQDKVDKINDRLGDMKQELQENNLLSKETMEKYMELQKLMDEITSEEMKKAMERLQNLLRDMNRKMTREELQNFKFDEERLRKSIERTLNLLKRVQIEQKMDELMKRAKDLMERQESLTEQTENSDLSDQKQKDNLSRKQDEITKDLEKLKNEMENLEEKMGEVPDMPMEEMEKLMEEFEKQQNRQLSEQAKQDIKQNRKQKAKQNQQQLSQNMKQMKQMMQQMMDSMQKQSQMQVFMDMLKILDNIISLSKQQEDLKAESESLEPASSALDELAKKEKNLSNNLNNIMQQMSDLSQKTFAVSPEMGKSLGDAKRQMENSVQAMKNRNGMLATSQQGEAMKSLNEAAMMMKNSMEAMMQGNGQGGMMSLMQQLRQMSGEQMNLNNLTQMLQRMQQGGLTPQQQIEMQRLAQQQELIQKSLEQLNQEAKVSGQSKKLPADLDDILKRMQEVITDMHGEKLDDELIQKQEHILSKLLDAQKSINERDFERERESRTGKTISREFPAEPDLSSPDTLNKIRDELNKAVKEGYSKDYEDLIRKYYDILQNENINIRR
jgi:hypothetical protein